MATEQHKAKKQFERELLKKMKKANPRVPLHLLKQVAKNRTQQAVKQFETQRSNIIKETQAVMRHDVSCTCKHPACPGTKAPAS